MQLTVHVDEGRTAVGTLAGGPAAAHTFDVTADFFLNGALVAEQTSTSIDAGCGFFL